MITLEYLRENYIVKGRLLLTKYREFEVGTIDYSRSSPYKRVKMHGEMWYVHRLIFWMINGYLPPLVDHKDRDTLNNDPSNLRDLNHNQNLINAKLRKDNSSGFKGIRWHTKAKKWEARIGYKGVSHYLGLYDNLEDAIKSRKIMEDKFMNPETTLFAEA